MLKKIFGRLKLAKALQQNDPLLLLKAIRSGEDLNQPLSLNKDSDIADELSPIEHCLGLQHPECLQKLLESGAQLPLQHRDGRLLLVHAIEAKQHSLSLLTLLLQAGTDANAQHGEALFACLCVDNENQQLLLINRLIEHGADINRHRRLEKRLLDQLMLEERMMVVGVLISAGAELSDKLDQLSCSDELKQFARRKTQDLAVQRQLLGS
ncbi:MAG: hypothetical protein V7707_06445 [Motiliproteus sp.]